MEIKLESTYKGTRILYGDDAWAKRKVINTMADLLSSQGYKEIMFPVIQHQNTFKAKVGEENRNMMFDFKDRGDRDICLAPEYTAIVQQLSKETFKLEKDVHMFYVAECFRGEKPQAGRLRQFTQIGVEILNPTEDYSDTMASIALFMVKALLPEKHFVVNKEVTRGLDYYTGGKGFEIICEELGAQKQVVGGGSYDGGIGFAIGIDRLLILM